jgi:hypothetical protein
MAGARGGKDAARLGALLASVLRSVQQEHGPLFAIQRAWPQVVGRQLAAHTRPASLRKGRLLVYAERPGDSFTLKYERPRLIEALRQVSEGKVDDLVIRPGEPDAPKPKAAKPRRKR